MRKIDYEAAHTSPKAIYNALKDSVAITNPEVEFPEETPDFDYIEESNKIVKKYFQQWFDLVLNKDE